MEWAFDREQAMLIVWSMFLGAVVSITARLIVRLRIFGRLLLDDYLALFALFCLLADNLTFTIALPVFEATQNVSYYHHKPPSNFESLESKFEKAQWAIAYAYFTGLWVTKAVFLVCYWKLTEDLKTYRRAWYALVTFTVLTYIGCLVAYPLLNYVKHPDVASFKTLSIKYQFAADLSTDILSESLPSSHRSWSSSLSQPSLYTDPRQLHLVTMLPITLFLRASITPSRHIAPLLLCTLSLLTTCVAIARFAVDAPNGRNYGTLWLTVWSTIQLSVAVIVASFVVLRSLVAWKRDGGSGSGSDGSAGRSRSRVVSAYEFSCQGLKKTPLVSGMWRGKKEPWPTQEGVLERPRGARLLSLSSSKYLSGGYDLNVYTDSHGVDLCEDLLWA
ncbi:MAG: hypothetical protein Q9165_007251 [Trypethelium subeluteriae]